jgi:hypothetical protein
MTKRSIDPADLVGIAEIAERAHVGPSAVVNWRQRHADFPEPLASPSSGPVFYWPDISAWLTSTGRQT